MSTTEQSFVENQFGTVTNKRVVYYRNKTWFSGGSREDIPLQHVTSVRLDITRSIVIGLLSLVIGLAMLGGTKNGSAGLIVFGLLLAFFGILLLWGSPTVVVNTAGNDLKAAKGWPWHRNLANTFVEALRTQLFNRAP